MRSRTSCSVSKPAPKANTRFRAAIMPTTTYSAHYIADPGLRRAIADYLVRERAYVAAAGEELSTLAPFRKDFVVERE